MKMTFPNELFNNWLFTSPEVYNRIIHCVGQFDKRSYSILRRFLNIVHTERKRFEEKDDMLEFDWEWDKFTLQCVEEAQKHPESEAELTNLEMEYILNFFKEDGQSEMSAWHEYANTYVWRIKQNEVIDVLDKDGKETEEMQEMRAFLKKVKPFLVIQLSNIATEMVREMELVVALMEEYRAIVRYSKLENPTINLEILAWPKIF